MFSASFLLISTLFIAGKEFEDSLDPNDQMFKPGWKDIFRMNENELESEIRKVYRDSSLDPRRKAYLVQNLLTRLVLLIVIYFIYLNYLKISKCVFVSCCYY